MEGLGAGACAVHFIALLTSLNLEVVMPVRATTIDQLPKTRCWVGKEEQRPPTFVLLNVDPFMGANDSQFLLRDSNDDMPEDDASER